MTQTLITYFIIALCALYIGRKLYRWVRAAINPHKKINCGCSCTDCSVSSCDEEK